MEPNKLKLLYKEFNIVNTGSFNYGIPLGGRRFNFFVDRNSHNNLDISHPHDSLARRRLTQKQRTSYYWKFEESYYKKDGSGRYRGQYADIVKNGYRDYYAWNSVREKKEVYQRFVAYCRSIYPKNNHGFYYFLKKKEKFFKIFCADSA